MRSVISGRDESHDVMFVEGGKKEPSLQPLPLIPTSPPPSSLLHGSLLLFLLLTIPLDLLPAAPPPHPSTLS